MHTPGHTPEHISFILTDEGGGSEVPMGIFTGDFVFVGDVGRPDLLEKAAGIEGTATNGATQMFHSLERFEICRIIFKFGQDMEQVVHVESH